MAGDEGKGDYLTIDELRRFHEAIPKTSARDKLIMYMMSHMGMRVGEVANLRWADVSMTGRSITIRRTAEGKNTTKGGAWRTLEIDSEVWNWLTRYSPTEESRNGYVIMRYRLKPSSKEEKPMTTRNIHKLVARYAKVAGLETAIHPHILRHAFAIHYLRAGGALEDLRRILGHSRLDMTQRYLRYTGKVGITPKLPY